MDEVPVDNPEKLSVGGKGMGGGGESGLKPHPHTLLRPGSTSAGKKRASVSNRFTARSREPSQRVTAATRAPSVGGLHVCMFGSIPLRAHRKKNPNPCLGPFHLQSWTRGRPGVG